GHRGFFGTRKSHSHRAGSSARRPRGQGARQRARQARGVDEVRKIGVKEEVMASVPQTKISSARQDLYRRMDKHNTAPLWEVLHGLIPDEPVTRCKPYLWKYKDVRPYISEAGKLITAK